jgi:hypothetical protein
VATTGVATVDFGAFPGSSDATTVVTGQAGILGTSYAEAWLTPIATADHSEDEHMVEQIDVFVAALVAATGFTIRAFSRSRGDTRLYGLFSVAWVWT